MEWMHAQPPWPHHERDDERYAPEEARRPLSSVSVSLSEVAASARGETDTGSPLGWLLAAVHHGLHTSGESWVWYEVEERVEVLLAEGAEEERIVQALGEYVDLIP